MTISKPLGNVIVALCALTGVIYYELHSPITPAPSTHFQTVVPAAEASPQETALSNMKLGVDVSRGGFDNITGHGNPFFVNSVIDPTHPSPTFTALEGRAFTSRIRLLGRK